MVISTPTEQGLKNGPYYTSVPPLSGLDLEQALNLNIASPHLIISELSQLNPKLIDALAKNWTVGTIIEATVEKESEKSISLKSEQGPLKLPLSEKTPFSTGQKILIHVLAKSPVLTLQLSAIAAAPTKSEKFAPPVLTPNVGTFTTLADEALETKPSSPLQILRDKIKDVMGTQNKTAAETRPLTLESLRVWEKKDPSAGSFIRSLPLPQSKSGSLTLAPLPPEFRGVQQVITETLKQTHHTDLLRTPLPMGLASKLIAQWPARISLYAERLNSLVLDNKGPVQLTQENDEKALHVIKSLNETIHLLRELVIHGDKKAAPDAISRLIKQLVFADPSTATAASLQPRPINLPSTLRHSVDLLIQLQSLDLNELSPEVRELIGKLLKELDLSLSDSKLRERTAELLNEPRSVEQSNLKSLSEDLAKWFSRQQLQWLTNLRLDMPQQGLFAQIPSLHNEQLNLVELAIREDESNENESETKAYVVRLRFDLDGLGPMQFVLNLHGDDLSMQFYAEQTATVQLFETYLDTLVNELGEDGIHLAPPSSHNLPTVPSLIQDYPNAFYDQV